MPGDPSSPPPPRPGLAALAADVRRLEEALRQAQRALIAAGEEGLPGLYLVVEAAGRRGLLPAARVSEVVRMVATRPLAGAPPHVLGTFSCRGAPVVAVDLAALLGAAREPGLEARIAILPGAPTLGLVVDGVARLADGPRPYGGDPAEGTPEAWRGSSLVAGLCVDQGEVLPLLDPSPLRAGLAAALATPPEG